MLNPWYITGFCDGEAAFTYSRAGGTFNLYFSIKQREDRRQIVEEIQAYFGYIGKIYFHPAAVRSAGVHYRVTKTRELKRIIEHFDKYPLHSQKLGIYQVWRQMALYKAEHYRGIEYDRLRLLAEKLSALNLQSRVFKVHKR